MSAKGKDKNENGTIGRVNGNIRNTEGEKEGIFPGAWPNEDGWLLKFEGMPSISRYRRF